MTADSMTTSGIPITGRIVDVLYGSQILVADDVSSPPKTQTTFAASTLCKVCLFSEKSEFAQLSLDYWQSLVEHVNAHALRICSGHDCLTSGMMHWGQGERAIPLP